MGAVMAAKRVKDGLFAVLEYFRGDLSDILAKFYDKAALFMIQDCWALNFCDTLIAVNASHEHIAEQESFTNRVIVIVDEVECTINGSAIWEFFKLLNLWLRKILASKKVWKNLTRLNLLIISDGAEDTIQCIGQQLSSPKY